MLSLERTLPRKGSQVELFSASVGLLLPFNGKWVKLIDNCGDQVSPTWADSCLDTILTKTSKRVIRLHSL